VVQKGVRVRGKGERGRHVRQCDNDRLMFFILAWGRVYNFKWLYFVFILKITKITPSIIARNCKNKNLHLILKLLKVLGHNTCDERKKSL